MADGGNEGSPSSGLPWLAGLLLLWVVLSVATVLLMTADYPAHNEAGPYFLVACPLYIVAVGAWRTIGPDAAADHEQPATQTSIVS